MFVNHSTTEEPYEVKVSRTVLKTSRQGDLAAEFNRHSHQPARQRQGTRSAWG